MDPLVAFLVALYGFGVSWIEERFGAFQALPARTKQLVNSLLAFVVPLVVTNWICPWWQADFGNSTEVTTALLTLLAPVGVWLISQVAHYIDKGLAKATAR